VLCGSINFFLSGVGILHSGSWLLDSDLKFLDKLTKIHTIDIEGFLNYDC